MSLFSRSLAFLTFAVGAFGMSAAFSRAAELKEGDKAPVFELPGSDGETYKLEDFRDKQVVVIAWFPRAFTGG